MRSLISKLLVLACTALLCVQADAATITASLTARPMYLSATNFPVLSATIENNDDLAINATHFRTAQRVLVQVTASDSTTTLSSLASGLTSSTIRRGQQLELVVVNTNTLVVPSSLSNTDFGTAGDANVVEGHSLLLTWDGSAWRQSSLSGLTATRTELNLLDGVTSTAAELNLLDGVTSTTAELNLPDNQVADLVYTVNAESTDTVTVNVQANDAAGTAMATPVALTCYLSSDAAGLDIATTAEDIAAGTDGDAVELTDNIAFLAVSEADGDIDIVVTETAAADVYIVCVLPTGALDISAVLDFTA